MENCMHAKSVYEDKCTHSCTHISYIHGIRQKCNSLNLRLEKEKEKQSETYFNLHNHSQKHFIPGSCSRSSLYFTPYSLTNKLRNIQPNRWLGDHRTGNNDICLTALFECFCLSQTVSNKQNGN